MSVQVPDVEDVWLAGLDSFPLAPITEEPHWGVYRLVPNGGAKPDKVPTPKRNEPWWTYADARAKALNGGGYAGMGFNVLKAGRDAIDLDHCRNKETGEIDDRAQFVLDECLGAYVEVSPSKDGLKVIGAKSAKPRFLQIDFRTSPVAVGLIENYTTITFNGQGDPNTDISTVIDEWTSKIPKSESGRYEPNTNPDSRHEELFKMLRSWKAKGLSFEAAMVECRAFNQTFDKGPLAEKEVESYLARAWQQKDDPGFGKQDADVLDPKHPLESARRFVGGRHLRHQEGRFWAWDSGRNCWLPLEEPVVRAQVWAFLDASKKRGEDGPKPFCPTGRAVSEVMDAVRAVTNLPASFVAPCWLDGRDSVGLIAFRNGLRTADGTLLPPDPAYYNHITLPFDYQPGDKEAPEWFKFLESLWPDDAESIATLQEIFGCFVSGDLRFQKIFMLVGPKRGGKDTTARVLKDLLGHANVCGPTLSSLGETFGRECLIGKSAAVISDARLTGRSDPAVVVEELLAISGEGGRTVQRKFLPAWSGQLRVRFLVLTNELPRIEDSSGALASRFVILRLTKSFYGKEDLGLYGRLVPELPAILNWALEGWERLRARGYFVQPKSSAQLVQEFEDLGSPINAFLRDYCDQGPLHQESQVTVYRAWCDWCERNGRQHVGTVQTFAKDLRAALPNLDVRKVGGKGAQERHWIGLRLKAGGGDSDGL